MRRNSRPCHLSTISQLDGSLRDPRKPFDASNLPSSSAHFPSLLQVLSNLATVSATSARLVFLQADDITRGCVGFCRVTFRDQLGSLLVFSGLMRKDAQQMPRIKMIGINRQYLMV